MIILHKSYKSIILKNKHTNKTVIIINLSGTFQIKLRIKGNLLFKMIKKITMNVCRLIVIRLVSIIEEQEVSLRKIIDRIYSNIPNNNRVMFNTASE